MTARDELGPRPGASRRARPRGAEPRRRALRRRGDLRRPARGGPDATGACTARPRGLTRHRANRDGPRRGIGAPGTGGRVVARSRRRCVILGPRPRRSSQR